MQKDNLAPVAIDAERARPSRPLVRLLRLLQWVVPVALLIVLARVLLSQLSAEQLREVLSHASTSALLLGLLFYAATNVARAVRMACLLERPASSVAHLVPVMFVLSLLNNVLPFRAGELSFPYLMQYDGVEWGTSLTALLVARLFDLLAVCLLFLVAAAGQSALLSSSGSGLLGAAVGAAVVLIALLASLPALGSRLLHLAQRFLQRYEGSTTGWRAALSRQLEEAAGALRMLRSGSIYRKALFISILVWVGTFAWFAFFLAGAGMATPFGQVILGASFSVISKSLPVGSVLGFGAHEAGWTLGFTLIGQEVSKAILGGFAVNLLTLLCSAVLGLTSAVWLAVRRGHSLTAYLSAVRQRRDKDSGRPSHFSTLLRRDGLLVGILIIFIALGTWYSVVTPLFETPDEVWHYLYVKYVADGHGLPVYREGDTFPMHQEASQPPLYYLLNGWATSWVDTSDAEVVIRYNPHAAIGAPSTYDNRNMTAHTSYESFPYRGTVLAAHLSRLLSVCMGAGTVLCTWAIARRLFPETKWVAPAAAAFNAFHPQFLFISASINNDVLTTLLAALSLWLLVCIAQDGPSPGRLSSLGAVLGLAALSKLNALVLLPLAGVVLFAVAWRRGHRLAFITWMAWTLAAAAAVGGWWYVRNWILYRDPFGLKLMFAVLAPHAERPSITRLLYLLDGARKSFWGVFGWFNIPLEPWIYLIFDVGLVVALLGLLKLLYSLVTQKRSTQLLRVGLLLLWTTTFIMALAGWSQARFPQGRLLFPAMPAIATLFVLGWAQWFPRHRAEAVIAVVLTTLLALAVVVPYRYIAPAYARAARLSLSDIAGIEKPLSVEFGGCVRLLGFELSEDMVRPGARLWVTLYWQGTKPMDSDYSVFIHLVDSRGATIAQRDSYPGGGNDPTRGWEPGEVLRDMHPLDIPTTLLAEAPCRVQVGLYDYDSGQRLAVSGGVAEDSFELPVQLDLQRGVSAAVQEVYFEFGERIALTAFSVEPIAARAGDTLRIILRWRALQTLHEDYTAFAHLMRTGAQIWGQNDHAPGGAHAPTSTWKGGDVVTDEFELRISPDAPEDSYELIVGLYNSATVKRLSLPNGVDWIVLGKIEVSRQ